MENIHPVIGVDVAKEFCFYSVLSPTGKTYLKPFKALNNNKGLLFVLKEIKKAEKAFSSTPIIVLESTGHYSNRLVHFFPKNGLKVFLINPLLSHSIKNSTIRKVKTDKVDAEELAKLYFFQDLREFKLSNESLENLKILSRTYFHISEQRVCIINQLVASIEQVMPSFTKIFNNVSSKTAIALLVEYPSPDSFLTAPQENIIALIRSCSRKTLEYANKKY
ncbi:IS110 family transposase [Anaerophilus nitritogenes]|uniref:IS110 family transposase n=1 Tax=Anaerophilus nitritogenes TaxID=2498136 RepID=UPI00101CA4F8|nr:transposase [Anaerophilus nitritogenes]